MIEQPFVSCHIHPMSLDSGSTPKDFLKRELELKTGAFCCTDHGSLGAAKEIYDLAKKNSLIPIIGLEAYFRDDTCKILSDNSYYVKNDKGAFINSPKYQHITIHAMDYPAYLCMVRLLSQADARLESTLETLESKDRKHGHERKPLFKWNDLEELGSHNITFTTGCMIGIIKRHIKDNNDFQTAIKYLERLISIVKPGNLYVELNPHDTSHNYEKGVFVTTKDDKLKFHPKKKLLTNVGEIDADQLAIEFHKGEHKILKSIKNRSKWQEMPEVEMLKAEHLEGFFPNEGCDWAPDGDLEKGLNTAMRGLAKRYKLPILVGDDSHYAHPEQKIIQDVRLAQSGSWKFYGRYHRQSSQEAFEHFQKTIGTTEDQFNVWVENSQNWAQRFKDFKFESKPELPVKFYEEIWVTRPWYKEGDKNNSLRYIMELIKKHGRMDWKNKSYVERLEAEIKLYHGNGTIDLLPYFMTAEEVCDFYTQKGLLTGVGRGSAGGTLLSYLLGITHIDPLRYDLSLDRFLSLDRIKTGNLPDIDQDLPRQERDLLVNQETGWLKQRFGDHYAPISTDSKLRLRNAVKDVSRYMRGEVPFEIEKLTKQFLQTPVGVEDIDFILGYDTDEGPVQGSIEVDPALQEYVKKYPDDWRIVQDCLGLNRQKSKHASAFAIMSQPIHEVIPLTTVSGVRCTAYTMKAVEAVGGIKNDYLGLNTLSDLSNAIKLIQQRSGLDIPKEIIIDNKKVPGFRLVPLNGQFYDIWDLPEDQAVFKDVALAKTETVFQYNTPGVQKWLSHFAFKDENGQYGINSIMSMAALTALDRPGALNAYVKNPDTGEPHNMLVEYARRARGAEPSPDVPEIFSQMIPETYSVLTYQEQVQNIYQYLSGCSGPEAEQFRRDVSKKEKQKLEKLYSSFMESATNKIGKENAQSVWDKIITFSAYGFCKAHAVAYAITGYACAYLKHYYPLEWWTSVLKNADKNEINEKFWMYAGHLIDLPDINLSSDNFEIKNERIRAPLSLLKGVGDMAHAQITKFGPYKDIYDFCLKSEKYKLDTGTVQEITKLIKDSANKVINPKTGRKVASDIEVICKKLEKGHSAINRGVVQKLIISGAMDSLFPEEMHLGEQLQAYEDALAAATNEVGLEWHKQSGDPKPYKPVKVESVDPNIWDIGPFKRYQMRKQILPAFGADLRQHWHLIPDIPVSENNGSYKLEWNDYYNKTQYLDIISGNELIQLNSDNYRPETVAVIAYIESVELGKFTKDGVTKEKCKIILDIESAKFEFMKWGSHKTGKVGDIYHNDIAGSIALVVLNRYKSGKGLSIEDLILIEWPLKEKND